MPFKTYACHLLSGIWFCCSPNVWVALLQEGNRRTCFSTKMHPRNAFLSGVYFIFPCIHLFWHWLILSGRTPPLSPSHSPNPCPSPCANLFDSPVLHRSIFCPPHGQYIADICFTSPPTCQTIRSRPQTNVWVSFGAQFGRKRTASLTWDDQKAHELREPWLVLHIN